MEPELKTELEKINRSLVSIVHKTESIWRAFVRGLVHGIGSVLGVVAAVLLIGWILNTMGIIPGLKEQATKLQNMWQETLDQTKRIR